MYNAESEKCILVTPIETNFVVISENLRFYKSIKMKNNKKIYSTIQIELSTRDD